VRTPLNQILDVLPFRQTQPYNWTLMSYPYVQICREGGLLCTAVMSAHGARPDRHGVGRSDNAVSPDWMYAGVGHDAPVSYVNLATASNIDRGRLDGVLNAICDCNPALGTLLDRIQVRSVAFVAQPLDGQPGL